jgi:hypothetical protein
MSRRNNKKLSPILGRDIEARLTALLVRQGRRPAALPQSGRSKPPNPPRVHCAGQLELFSAPDYQAIGVMRCPCPDCSGSPAM